MKLQIKQTIAREICHFTSPEYLITSQYNRIYIKQASGEQVITLPADPLWQQGVAKCRLGRRFLRLDKCNVVPVPGGLVIVRQGRVYHYDLANQKLTPTLQLRHCQAVLHQSICVTPEKWLYLAEYGANPKRQEVPIYRSRDLGRTWETIMLLPAGKVKHLHGCYHDPVEDKLWVFTGDFKGECFVLVADRDFKSVEWIGNGEQEFRACNAYFLPDTVHWIMDSQLQDSYHMILDRRTRVLTRGQLFPGPVWYSKQLASDCFLAATTQELGPGVRDQYAHLMWSSDLRHWESLHRFKHDGWLRPYFKNGVIAFADGPQTPDSFYLFGEALKGFDGVTLHCELAP